VSASALGARRAPRHVLVGAALMVAFALLFGLVAFRADPAVPVLAVVRPVPAGQVIVDADLGVVRVAPEPGVELFGEAERAAVVGRTARVPLVAGSLLAPGQVGAAAWPNVGESVVAVPVPAGRLPDGLTVGSRVNALLAAGEGAQPAGPVVPATVVAVVPATSAGVSTVSLLVRSVDAPQVGAASEVVLILESPGSR
jgi:hypothetical protein